MLKYRVHRTVATIIAGIVMGILLWGSIFVTKGAGTVFFNIGAIVAFSMAEVVAIMWYFYMTSYNA